MYAGENTVIYGENSFTGNRHNFFQLITIIQ